MIVDAFNYKLWADARALRAIENVPKDSRAFMLQQINHMVIVEELFTSRLMNAPAPHSSTNTKTAPGFDELRLRLEFSGQWYLNYVSNLSKEKYGDIISFTFADGKRGAMSIDEMLFHIINHGSYHRGSIAHALDLAGVPHPPDGYGIYLHEKAPERRVQT